MKDYLYQLPKTIAKILNPPSALSPAEKLEEESDKLRSDGMKIIIPSNISDIWTRREVLLGLKLSGHTDTPAEASNPIDEIYTKRKVLKTNNNIEMLFINLLNKWSCQVSFWKN